MNNKQDARTGWRVATLQELVYFQRGYDITKAEQKPGAIPVVSSSGINSYHSEAKADGPGVVIGRKGTLGAVHYLEGPYWPHDTTLWSRDMKGNHARYVYYFLQTLGLQRYDVGNSNPTLNRNHIHSLEIRIPEYRIQESIAAILSAYDDLIAANRRRIALLEQAARLLYREWFVQLRFPGHEAVRVVEGVPEGWERKTLGEVSSWISRGITPQYDDDAVGIVINQKCIRDRFVTLDVARRQAKEVPAEKLVQHGDVLINSTGEGTLGRVAQFYQAIENCTVDSHVTIARAKHGIPTFLYGYQVMALESVLAVSGRGATNQTELSRSAIAESSFLLPSLTIGEQFEATVKNFIDQMQNLLRQNQQLAAARDLLLPRLMNGEIEV